MGGTVCRLRPEALLYFTAVQRRATTGCLEDMVWLYGNVRHLGLVAVGVHHNVSDAKLVGVGRGCQATAGGFRSNYWAAWALMLRANSRRWRLRIHGWATSHTRYRQVTGAIVPAEIIGPKKAYLRIAFGASESVILTSTSTGVH
jgi:hypothetical protein